MVEIGEPAPKVTLPDEEGRDVTAPVDGAPAVLVFYRGDW